MRCNLIVDAVDVLIFVLFVVSRLRVIVVFGLAHSSYVVIVYQIGDRIISLKFCIPDRKKLRLRVEIYGHVMGLRQGSLIFLQRFLPFTGISDYSIGLFACISLGDIQQKEKSW